MICSRNLLFAALHSGASASFGAVTGELTDAACAITVDTGSEIVPEHVMGLFCLVR